METQNIAKIEVNKANFDRIGKELKGREAQIIIGAYGDGDFCTAIVEKKITPEDGGIYTKFLGCSYLYKGYPNIRIVELLEMPKDMLSQIPTVIHSMSIIVKIALVFFLLFLRIFAKEFLMRLAEIYIHAAVHPLEKHLLEPKRYCVSVREVYRTLGVLIGETKTQRMHRFLTEIQSIFCMAMEYDSAYKFRLQDILPEFDIEAIKRSPTKEIKRVVDILISRENNESMGIRWRRTFKIALLFLKMSKRARKFLIMFFEEIDLDKTKLDEADWYFCLRRKGYNARGISFDERLEIKARIDKEKEHKIPPVQVRQIKTQ